MTLHVKQKELYGSEEWEPYLNRDNEKWDANPIEEVHMQSINGY